MRTLEIRRLGLVPYADALAMQRALVEERRAGRVGDLLLLLQHPPVLTVGVRGDGGRSHILATDEMLKARGIDVCETGRGGDVTYHGPGQIVAYPILNLGAIRRDVVWYVRMLEEAMIRATAEFGIAGGRETGKTGVWVGEGKTSEKLAAIGVHISRWVTSHGLAYNVSTDLRNFDLIVPCGIADRKATSLEKLLGRSVKLDEVKPKLAQHLGEVFGLELQQIARAELLEKLETVEQPVAATA